MMALAPVLVALLSCVSPLLAVRTCDSHVSLGFLRQTQADWITAFSGLNTWLVSASPDDEFGATESYSLAFNASCGNSVIVYIRQTFSDGRVTDHAHALIKEYKSDYYYEPGFELYLNFFPCSTDLIAAYKCMLNANGKTLFLIISPQSKKPADVSEQLATCKKTIRNIYPQAEFKDMYFPGTVPAKKGGLRARLGGAVKGLVGGVVGGVSKLVDDLL